MSYREHFLLALLYFCAPSALSLRSSDPSGSKMIRATLRTLAARNFLKRNSFGKFGNFCCRGISLAAVTTEDEEGSNDLDNNDITTIPKKENYALHPSYTYENLPEETLYVMDGTSMIFTAHYRWSTFLYVYINFEMLMHDFVVVGIFIQYFCLEVSYCLNV